MEDGPGRRSASAGTRRPGPVGRLEPGRAPPRHRRRRRDRPGRGRHAGRPRRRSPRLLPVLDRRIVADPGDAEARRLRGDIHARAGRWDDAADDLRLALTSRPSPSPPWFRAGWWVIRPYPEDMDRPTRPRPIPTPSGRSPAPIRAPRRRAGSPGGTGAWHPADPDRRDYLDLDAFRSCRAHLGLCPDPQSTAPPDARSRSSSRQHTADLAERHQGARIAHQWLGGPRPGGLHGHPARGLEHRAGAGLQHDRGACPLPAALRRAGGPRPRLLGSGRPDEAAALADSELRGPRTGPGCNIWRPGRDSSVAGDSPSRGLGACRFGPRRGARGRPRRPPQVVPWRGLGSCSPGGSTPTDGSAGRCSGDSARHATG